MLPESIDKFIEENRWQDAIDLLTRYIEDNPDDDAAMYARGRLLWKIGERARALACYREAVAINPRSPARHALAMANDVFDFYNPDLLNP